MLTVRLALTLPMPNSIEHWLLRVMHVSLKMFSSSVTLKFRVMALLLKSELTSQLEASISSQIAPSLVLQIALV